MTGIPTDFQIMQSLTHADGVAEQCMVESEGAMNCAQDHRNLRDMLTELLAHRQAMRAAVELPVIRVVILELLRRAVVADATDAGTSPTTADMAADLTEVVDAARVAIAEGASHDLEEPIKSIIGGSVLPALWPEEVQV